MSGDGVKSWQGKTRHGTQSGWSKHKKEGSDPCDACVAAKREYDARWKAIPENTMRNRLHARAQARAYKALRHRHPEEYRALYTEAADALFADVGIPRQKVGRQRKGVTP